MVTKHYDWVLLNKRDIRDKYVLELRNRFETLQEKTKKGTPNDEYENFVNAHFEEAANCIPTKPKTKYRVTWETLAVTEKRADVKTASKSYRKNPTNTNALKLKKAQNELASIYLKEQTECVQNQIDKIRDSEEDRQIYTYIKIIFPVIIYIYIMHLWYLYKKNASSFYCIYIYTYHHHHGMPLARISLTLTHYTSLSSYRSRQVFHAASCISTELLLIGSSWWLYFCSSVEYIVYELALISPVVFCMSCLSSLDVFRGGVGVRTTAALWDAASRACSIQLTASLCILSIRLVSVYVVQPYSSIDMTAAWKKTAFCFIW